MINKIYNDLRFEFVKLTSLLGRSDKRVMLATEFYMDVMDDISPKGNKIKEVKVTFENGAIIHVGAF